ncbi:fused MFS/spermidine synthase [Azospirillum sp. TSO22-1]|uniref:fused MFS/spermidine synthase n=1 Tax=Azospirillum sp. TSO22-1 TaxID=716789 RepID=UPI0011B7CE50|nr:fused MFS/spermidine synthase [Azospirillum sp. TSO22-1]
MTVPASRPAPYALPLAAFAGGWALMMLEILGGRLMAPQYGYSVYQWGAVIGVVLGFMAAGYWKGGSVGDGPDAIPVLRGVLLVAAAWAALTPWLGPAALERTAPADPQVGSLAGAALLLGVPSFALAMVSPICAGRIAAAGRASAAGRIYAVGTLGSIGGTFFAAFFAIPTIGVSAGYAVAAAVLAAACALVPGGRTYAAGALVLALGALGAVHNEGRGFALYRETPHNTIWVRETAEEVRLHLNLLWATQSRLRKDGGPTGLYYDVFPAGPALADGARTLVLGVAGGVGPMNIRRAWPESDVLGVELDPAVVAVAREKFGLRGVRVAVSDARRFVAADPEKHDLIVVDLYNGATIPFFTATREFFALLERKLDRGGVVMMNVASPADHDILIGPLAATLKAAFPSVFVSDVGGGNYFLIATREERTTAELLARLDRAPPAAQDAARRLAWSLAPADTAGQPVLTDDKSDIDLRSIIALYGE